MSSPLHGHDWRQSGQRLLRTVRNTLQDPFTHTILRNLLLILIWYLLSTLLSVYNKTLLGRDNGLEGRGYFPAPLFMCGVQFAFQWVLAQMVFGMGLIERTRGEIEWSDYCKIVLPNGVLTGIDIGFSNKSLAYITMSFYVMCKSTVPIFLLLCAFIWRIERPNWHLAGVVAVITAGLVLLVAGEDKFDLTGFLLVMSASAMSGVRFTLTQVSLHGHDKSVAMGGPLEVLELLTPIMAVSSLILSVVWEDVWDVLPRSPYMSTPTNALITLVIIGCGSIMAFLMVWTEYKVIKETSALTFMIAGTCKEVITVIAAVLIFHDRFGPINGVGLAIVIVGVVLFNLYKMKRAQSEAALQMMKLDGGSEEELVPLVVLSSEAKHASANGLTHAAHENNNSTHGGHTNGHTRSPSGHAGQGSESDSEGGLVWLHKGSGSRGPVVGVHASGSGPH